MEPPKPLLIKLKESLIVAMKAGNADAKDALRVLLGNIQTLQAKAEVNDEQIVKLIKTLIGQNEEEIASRLKIPNGDSTYGETILKLCNQINFLKTFLPAFLTKEQIVNTLTMEENLPQIKSAKNDGAAVGIGLKILKSLPQFAGMAIDGGLVKEIVKDIYTEAK